MPHWAAISRWVRGGRAFRPYRRVMIMASRSSRHRLTHRRTLAQESRASSSSSILSSTLMVSTVSYTHLYNKMARANRMG